MNYVWAFDCSVSGNCMGNCVNWLNGDLHRGMLRKKKFFIVLCWYDQLCILNGWLLVAYVMVQGVSHEISVGKLSLMIEKARVQSGKVR